ncbi:MAG: septum formation initiator family protein [Acidobacteria bacterium]|nr:septum formation initiator family protein [Acidobacteriota bacterium]
MTLSRIMPDHVQPNARSSGAVTPPVSRFQWLRRWLLVLACGLLGVNVIMGDRVSIYSPQVHQQTALDHERLEHEIRQLKLDNRRKRDEARRLREDPAAIEALARRELGLIRRGEIVFLLADEPGVRRPLSR